MNNETEINEASPKPVTWSALLIRVFLIYAVFAVFSHLYFPAPTYNLPESQVLLFLPVAYLINFSAIFIPVVILTIFIAKASPKNRAKPLTIFINNSLIVIIIISALFIYGGYNSNRLAQNDKIKNTTVTPKQIKPVVVATT